MTEVLQNGDNLSLFIAEVNTLKRKINSSRGKQVRSQEIKLEAKNVVKKYWRTVRPELAQINLDLSELDDLMQQLMGLSARDSLKSAYKNVVKRIGVVIPKVEIKRELYISEQLTSENKSTPHITELDRKILQTLSDLIPSAALSYRQVLLDLQDSSRISFRGTAAELREVLREALDYLAPDEDVESSQGFVFEKDSKGNPLPSPTQKQKVRFILKSRGQTETARKPPEDAVSIIEESVASFTRSIYARGSLSTHKLAKRPEVQQIKGYTESVLCELLEIHRQE